MIFQHCFALQNLVKEDFDFVPKKNKNKFQNHGSCRVSVSSIYSFVQQRQLARSILNSFLL